MRIERDGFMKPARLALLSSIWAISSTALGAPPPPPPPSAELRFEIDGYAVDRVFAAYRNHAMTQVRERFEANKGKIVAVADTEKVGKIDSHKMIGFEVVSMNGLLVNGRISSRCMDEAKQECLWHYSQAVRNTRAITENDFAAAEAIAKLKAAGIAPRPAGDYPPSIVEIIGPGEDQLMAKSITTFATNTRSCPALTAFGALWDALPELAAEDFRTVQLAGPERGIVEHGPWLKITFSDYPSRYVVSSGVGQPKAVEATYERIETVLKNCGGEEWPVL